MVTDPHIPIYKYDPIPGELDGITWYAEKGLTVVRDIPLWFYNVPSWKSVVVGCPLKKFRGTLIQGKDLQEAIKNWFKIYKQAPEAL